MLSRAPVHVSKRLRRVHRAYGQGLMEQPLLGMHNAAGRVDGQPFPQWGRELWEPIR